jgi:hypothetical protein
MPIDLCAVSRTIRGDGSWETGGLGDWELEDLAKIHLLFTIHYSLFTIHYPLFTKKNPQVRSIYDDKDRSDLRLICLENSFS